MDKTLGHQFDQDILECRAELERLRGIAQTESSSVPDETAASNSLDIQNSSYDEVDYADLNEPVPTRYLFEHPVTPQALKTEAMPTAQDSESTAVSESENKPHAGRTFTKPRIHDFEELRDQQTEAFASQKKRHDQAVKELAQIWEQQKEDDIELREESRKEWDSQNVQAFVSGLENERKRIWGPDEVIEPDAESVDNVPVIQEVSEEKTEEVISELAKFGAVDADTLLEDLLKRREEIHPENQTETTELEEPFAYEVGDENFDEEQEEEFPSFDLAQQIMAEQRKLSSRRRQAPGDRKDSTPENRDRVRETVDRIIGPEKNTPQQIEEVDSKEPHQTATNASRTQFERSAWEQKGSRRDRQQLMRELVASDIARLLGQNGSSLREG